MSTLTADAKQLNDRISEKRSEAQEKWAAWEAARDALAGTPDAQDQESDGFKHAHSVHSEYGEVADEIVRMEATRDGLLAMTLEGSAPTAAQVNGDGAAASSPIVSAADRVLRSEAYQELLASGRLNPGSRARVEATFAEGMTRDELRHTLRGTPDLSHALVTGADDAQGGAFVRPDRKGFVPFRTRPLRLVDLVTLGDTDSDTVEYVEQTGFTNAAAETAEAIATAGTSGTKPESGLAFVVRSTTVKTIAHFVPATKRALADAGQMRTLIDGALRLGLDLRLDSQMASGDAVGENLRGIYNTPGIGSVTKVDAAAGNTNVPENKLDAIHRAITVVRLAFHEPSAAAMHPNDWQDLRLARDGDAAVANTGTTAGSYAKGAYLLGKPIDAAPDQVWGVPVVTGAQFTENRALVGDFAQAVLWLREGTQILASDSHLDFFVRNLVAVLAEMRAAFGVLAPGAFCTVAGL